MDPTKGRKTPRDGRKEAVNAVQYLLMGGEPILPTNLSMVFLIILAPRPPSKDDKKRLPRNSLQGK
jgi:hypothetical protein